MADLTIPALILGAGAAVLLTKKDKAPGKKIPDEQQRMMNAGYSVAESESMMAEGCWEDGAGNWT